MPISPYKVSEGWSDQCGHTCDRKRTKTFFRKVVGHSAVIDAVIDILLPKIGSGKRIKNRIVSLRRDLDFIMLLRRFEYPQKYRFQTFVFVISPRSDTYVAVGKSMQPANNRQVHKRNNRLYYKRYHGNWLIFTVTCHDYCFYNIR